MQAPIPPCQFFLLFRPFHWIDRPASDPCPAQTQSRLETGCERQVKNPPSSEQGRRTERLPKQTNDTAMRKSATSRCRPEPFHLPFPRPGRSLFLPCGVTPDTPQADQSSRNEVPISSLFLSAAPPPSSWPLNVCGRVWVCVCAPRLSLPHSLAEKCPHPAGACPGHAPGPETSE